MSGLQILGLSVVFATTLIGLVTWWLWKILPDSKKVWAVGLLVGWCGFISMLPSFLGPF